MIDSVSVQEFCENKLNGTGGHKKPKPNMEKLSPIGHSGPQGKLFSEKKPEAENLVSNSL
jgi:hypothetical protein